MRSRLRKFASCAALTALILAVFCELGRWANYRAKAQDELDHAMVEAVYQNDAPEVRRLLACGANPNDRDTYPKLSSVTRYLNRLLHYDVEANPGILPLFAAFGNPRSDDATFSNGGVARALLDYGADPNVLHAFNRPRIIRLIPSMARGVVCRPTLSVLMSRCYFRAHRRIFKGLMSCTERFE